ncbi:hypothetical protein ACFVR6_03860 [Microbacterium sp. NPDC058021]|uniref:hypothetical protein n=1 Tax=Microbacterium sp. NPDC058021 TaxID=3346306 RepID=UPI0036D98E4C
MSTVLGFDTSLTISGCARADLGIGADGTLKAVWWETWRGRAAAAEVETVASTRRRIRVMLREILALVPVSFDLAVVEGPAMGAKYTPLADERAGLRWMLVDQLLARGPVVLVSPMTRQSLGFSGKIPRGTTPTARKRLVTDAVRATFPGAHVPDHNVADAVVLAAAGAHALGMPWPVPMSAKQVSAHAKVAWPVVGGRESTAGKE